MSVTTDNPAGDPDAANREGEIFVDARCLQDPRFRDRGIGHHAAVLLAGASRFMPSEGRARLVAGIDRALPPLGAEHRALFDVERPLYTPLARGTIFLQPSPMTHSPGKIERIFTAPGVRTVAIVYDFIPLDHPDRYLADPTARREYLECLGALSDYQRFVSISEYSDRRLREVLGVSPLQCAVSGVAVRDSVISRAYGGEPPANYCLAVLGGDPRKNAELAIVAHARSGWLRDAGVGLKIVGHYAPETQAALQDLHRAESGDAGRLEFIHGISDGDLGALYRDALVTICPSRSEGFSIPVVEANANGCPVIVSDCPAHVELMPLPDYQFDPDDTARATRLIEMLAGPNARDDALARQGDFWSRFETTAVQERFWQFLLNDKRAGEGVQAPFVSRNARPKIAVASPMPPDTSGIADFTAATMGALAKRADVDIYTETRRPVRNRLYAGIHPLSPEPYIRRTHDGLVSVIGNSHFHTETLQLLLSYGGACIAHDARMVHFYASELGVERTTAIASHELGRPVPWSEVETWLANQRRMPILFLSEILESASTTFVHSPVTKALVTDIYKADTVHLPFAIYRTLSPEFDGPAGRRRARDFLGYDDKVKLLITLGDLVEDKAIPECIWTAAMLVEWGVPVRLVLVGRVHPTVEAYLWSLIDTLGLRNNIHITGSMVDERTYQAYLAAADAALQFRTYGFGGLSGAMLDEISVGLPVIANAHLADAMEAPGYVARVPDGLSPVLAAEQAAAIFERGDRSRYEDERRAFVTAHSVTVYADRLLEGLDLA